uniref:Reverse transcriptase domain-containing protein n=1 Tax=Hucho hucho TaxID=62062 RepID=A0A4W5Q8G8_9TELE
MYCNVKVFNDLLISTDSGDSAILMLLDLTAAFDTVDHCVLISRLEHSVGIKGTALEWFRSYLSERVFKVGVGGSTSPAAPLSCGVPQGSILGPILFSLYLLPLGSILKKHNISFHFYADDSQIYLPIKSKGDNSLKILLDCFYDIKAWMALNFLHFNESKTEVMIFRPSSSTGASQLDLGPLTPYVKPMVTNLGVKMDCDFQLEKQINSVVKASFFQLRLLTKLKPFLSFVDFERVIHAFITTRLDYCNALYVGINQASLSRLQMVQNAAARLLTGTRKRDHITPVLASLHWLPVCFRIHFKILLFVFKSLYGQAPAYISELLKPHDPLRSLRSADQLLFFVPRTRLINRGDRAFSVVAPRLWNDLPLHVRLAPSLHIFKSRLKTHFYSLA